jgi:hypothetical protein
VILVNVPSQRCVGEILGPADLPAVNANADALDKMLMIKILCNGEEEHAQKMNGENLIFGKARFTSLPSSLVTWIFVWWA